MPNRAAGWLRISAAFSDAVCSKRWKWLSTVGTRAGAEAQATHVGKEEGEKKAARRKQKSPSVSLRKVGVFGAGVRALTLDGDEV